MLAASYILNCPQVCHNSPKQSRVETPFASQPCQQSRENSRHGQPRNRRSRRLRELLQVLVSIFVKKDELHYFISIIHEWTNRYGTDKPCRNFPLRKMVLGTWCKS